MRTLTIYIVNANGEVEPVEFNLKRLVLGGWSGRKKEAVIAHIEELEDLKIPKPERVPAFFHVGINLLTCDRFVGVMNRANNGEVEYVVFFEGDGPKYVTVGSDHTDRELERFDFQVSKQLYPKVIPPIAWKYEEVEKHWDKLIIRMHVDGVLSQEASLEVLLKPLELFKEACVGSNGLVLFSGTIPSKSGRLAFGKSYRMEMEDPILRRRISYTYQTYEL
ncbi:MAG: DUF2848 family protein [Candidatus Bathyarchaeia archaeon]